MELGWRHALAAAAVLFIVFLVVKMRPGSSRRVALSAEVRAARERVRAATTPRVRAEALCDAGALAMRQGQRVTAAAGLFLRAMRADAAWAGAVERTAASLARPAPKLLEKILWRRLAMLPWDDEHAAAASAAARALEALYRKPIPDHVRAEVLRKLAAAIGAGGR